jgi:hypothetical protein
MAQQEAIQRITILDLGACMKVLLGSYESRAGRRIEGTNQERRKLGIDCP